MTTTLRRSLTGTILVIGCWAGWPQARAAEADKDVELRRKAAEVERLKEELNRAQSDLKKLKEDNERLRQEQARPTGAPAPAPAPKPVVPMNTLAPLQAGEVVEAHNLVGHFKADAAAAGQRYARKTFRVQGEIVGFEPRMLRHQYEVLLRSPETSMPVVCVFDYLYKFDSVYTKAKGRELVGKANRRVEQKLLEVGNPVTIQGQCLGLKGDELRFSGCQVVR